MILELSNDVALTVRSSLHEANSWVTFSTPLRFSNPLTNWRFEKPLNQYAMFVMPAALSEECG